MANEKRLIDGNELLKTVLNHFGVDLAYYGSDLQFCQEAIEFAPTVDAVEVVRCEDCTHYNGHRYCRYTELIVLDNDFCSYGERKEE